MSKQLYIGEQEADVLLERYYEGETSLQEEQKLHRFLAQKNLPERFNADRAIFGYWDKQRKKKKTVVLPMIRWAAAAAVVFGLVFLAKGIIPEKHENYAYIDGKKYTNSEFIVEQAMNSLNTISTSCNEVENSAEGLKGDDLVDHVLQSFHKD